MSFKKLGIVILFVAVLALTIVGVLVMGGQETAKADDPVYTGYSSVHMDPCDDWVMFDDFRVRKYCSDVPTCSNWSSEENSGANWYDTDWGYRQQGTVTSNNESCDTTNYQVGFTLFNSAGNSIGNEIYLNGHAQPDFDDIRFTEADGTTLLAYWLEEYNTGVSASVWVNFSDISTSGTDFYIYYGNQNAYSVSDGFDTFVIFNDGSKAGEEDGWLITAGSPFSQINYSWESVEEEGDLVLKCDSALSDSNSGWSNMYSTKNLSTLIPDKSYVVESRIKAGTEFITAHTSNTGDIRHGVGYGTDLYAVLFGERDVAAFGIEYSSGDCPDPYGPSMLGKGFNPKEWHDYRLEVKGGDYAKFGLIDDEGNMNESTMAYCDDFPSGASPEHIGMWAKLYGRRSGSSANAIAYWFEQMGYPTEVFDGPYLADMQSHVQSNQTAVFFSWAHGSHSYQEACCNGGIDGNTIKGWMDPPGDEEYTKMPFTYLHACVMCNAHDPGTLGYEFRKGQSEGAVTIHTCGQISGQNWNNVFFSRLMREFTVQEAFEEAVADYPSEQYRARLTGDGSLKLKSGGEPALERGASPEGTREPAPSVPAVPPTPTSVLNETDPEWTLMPNSAPPYLIRNIWGTSDDNVYAVRDDGAIMKYNGIGWGSMYPTTEKLRAIWGTSPADIYAVGDAILHYDGSYWEVRVSGSDEPGEIGNMPEQLRDIWGTDSADIFAVGMNGSIIHTEDGFNHWEVIDSGTNRSLLGIWGTGSDDVYAVGLHGTILHYDGTSWESMTSPIEIGEYESCWLNSIWGTSSDNIYTVGFYRTELDPITQESVILHYNGSEWARVDIYSDIQWLPARYFQGSGYIHSSLAWLTDIWGSSASDIYVVGNLGVILHYDGSNWKEMNSGTQYWIDGVWGTYSGHIFAVGTSRTILYRYDPAWQHVQQGSVAASSTCGNLSDYQMRFTLHNGTYSGSDITADMNLTVAVALGDVNGDGLLDLVAGNHAEPNRLYLNNGTADPFAGVNGSDITADMNLTVAVALGDMNGDGLLDLVVGNDDETNRLYLNNGTADPFAGVNGSDITADANRTYAVALGDVNDDGYLDMVVGNYGEPNRLYLNDGTGNFSGSDITADTYDTFAVVLGDVNGDDHLDLVVGNEGQTNRLYLNNGTSDPFAGVNGSDITADTNVTYAVALGDVNSDDHLDLVTGNHLEPNRLYLNNGTSDPFAGVNGSDITADTHYTMSVTLGDVNGDDHLDLAVGNGNQVNRLYLNDGTGIFTGSDVTADLHTTISLALGDVNDDGHLDLVAGNGLFTAQANRLYLNTGTSNPFAASGSSDSDVHLEGNCKSDFSDVLFTDIYGGLLDYWVEEYTSGDTATVWVKFDEILTTGTEFYIYYGNPGADSLSNGANTFPIFNDGTSIDWDEWSIHPTGGQNWSAMNGVIRYTGSGFGWGNMYQDAGLTSYVAEARIRAQYGLTTMNEQQGIGYGAGVPMARWIDSGSNNFWQLRDPWGVNNSATNTTFNAAQWHDYSFVKDGLDWEMYVDGDWKVSRTASDANYPRTGLYAFTHTSGHWAEFDDFRVRNYCYPEPTFGDWE